VMRNGGELCPTLHVTVFAAAYAPPDVTRNDKGLLRTPDFQGGRGRAATFGGKSGKSRLV